MSELKIYIIESTKPADIAAGRSEGRLLQQIMQLADTPATLRVVGTTLELAGSVLHAALDASHSHARPVIHLSAHGNNDGLRLTNGDFVRWADLCKGLRIVNEAFGGTLLVGMSSCFGLAGSRMAMVPDGPSPFFAIIGHPGEASWSDTAVGFAALYHNLRRGRALDDAVEAMRAASANRDFQCIRASKALSSWLDATANDPPEIREASIRSALEVTLGVTDLGG